MTLRKVDGGWRVDAQPGGRGGRRFRKTLKTQADAKAYDAWLTTLVGKSVTADQSSMLVRLAGSLS